MPRCRRRSNTAEVRAAVVCKTTGRRCDPRRVSKVFTSLSFETLHRTALRPAESLERQRGENFRQLGPNFWDRVIGNCDQDYVAQSEHLAIPARDVRKLFESHVNAGDSQKFASTSRTLAGSGDRDAN